MYHWKEYETAFYILLALLIFYFPPLHTKGMGNFIERHLGDSVGFYILHLGIVLVVISGIYPQVAGIYSTGQSLILAGTVALKLTNKPNGETTTVSQTVETTVPPSPQESPTQDPETKP